MNANVNKIIDNANKALNALSDGAVLCCWTSTATHAGHDYMRHDMHRLIRVYRHRDGFGYITSTPTCLVSNTDGEPCAYYPAGTVVKLSCGDGSRRMMPFVDLQRGQTGRPATLARHLKIGSGPYDMKSQHQSDAGLLRCLSLIGSDGRPPASTPILPDFWLTTRMEDRQLRLRRGLDPAELVPPNRRAEVDAPPLQWLLARPALLGAHQLGDAGAVPRMAWPYSKLYGRGVLTVDYRKNWQWWVQTEDIALPWLRIGLATERDEP